MTTISKDTALFLLGLFRNQNLHFGAPDAREASRVAFQAEDELLAVINSNDAEAPPEAPAPNRAQRRAAARKSPRAAANRG